ncbi:GNAT family N-acetyltransferase [Streptomyces echinatus]|uniref:GNAT family N-acetyltransferase n=1 Tax=Streptomyces echinatus TaxID=67293 RepID=UPI00379F3936
MCSVHRDGAAAGNADRPRQHLPKNRHHNAPDRLPCRCRCSRTGGPAGTAYHARPLQRGIHPAHNRQAPRSRTGPRQDPHSPYPSCRNPARVAELGASSPRDELIGLISLRRRTPSAATISYILREDSWGNGCATHAARQVVTVAFTTAGLNRLEAMHHPDHPASGRVLTKAGFTHVGTSERHTDDGSTCRTRRTSCRSREAHTEGSRRDSG